MIVNTETIKKLAAQDKRFDGRGFTDYRQPIHIDTEISWTAEGSTKVRIGETVVMAGVKLAIEKPYNDQGLFCLQQNKNLFEFSSLFYVKQHPLQTLEWYCGSSYSFFGHPDL